MSTGPAPETRARRRIRKAVESRGHSVLSINWEPWYDGGEMSGICGGWTVRTDAPWLPNTNYGDEAYGLSVEEVLAYIDWMFNPAEPCSCERPQFFSPLNPLRGEPQTGMHDEGCRWAIRYRLPWWTKAEEES